MLPPEHRDLGHSGPPSWHSSELSPPPPPTSRSNISTQQTPSQPGVQHHVHVHIHPPSNPHHSMVGQLGSLPG